MRGASKLRCSDEEMCASAYGLMNFSYYSTHLFLPRSCRGPIRYARILSSGFGSVLALTSRSGEGPRLQTTNVWDG